MFQHITRSSRVVWEVIVVALVLIAGSASTMSVAYAKGHPTVPSTSPTPNGTPTGPTPNFIVPGGGDTGEYTKGATSNAYCNGNLYTGWTALDGHLYVAWNFTGSSFGHKVEYKDTTYYTYSTNPTTYTRPILACWTPSSGSYSGTTRLWILFTGTNKVLYLGYFDPADEQQAPETVSIHVHTAVPNQTSVLSPALSPAGGTLRLGWVGVNNGHPNFESTNDGVTFFSWNDDANSASDGGFGMTLWNGNLWFAYPGFTTTHYIYVEYFKFSAGTWVHAAWPTADYTGALDDLTLVPQGSTLRMPYAGVGLANNLNIDNSTDGVNWSNDQSQAGILWGAGAAVDASNHFWVSFPNHNSPDSPQIVLFTYN